jgi:O-antigen/teichoic acid export membrane protein
MKSLLKEKILHSGIIFTAISLVSGFGNFLYQSVIGRRLDAAEYGFANAADAFTGLLGLPILMASTAVIHHIAHFRGTKNEARLQGLLVGCQSFLLKLTVAGCVLGVVLIQPLSRYFGIPRTSLTMAALTGLIIALWSGYAMALAQGMGWFKRLALIGLAGVIVRIAFVSFATRMHPVAEASVLAVATGTLLYLLVFAWWRDLVKSGERISPWDGDFFLYLAVAAAGVLAQYCFTKGDMLVASKYFSATDMGAYAAAAKISSALHFAVSPLLLVLFTARSSERAGQKLGAPLGLLLLYAAGLATGAFVLFFARDLCVKLIFGQPSAVSSAMIARLAMTMIFVGLIQALGMWALASHWLKMGLLYGALGVAYWATLLIVARQTTPRGTHLNPATLLNLMPVIAAACFAVMFITWVVTLRRGRARG